MSDRSVIGMQLYELLPAMFRNRDRRDYDTNGSDSGALDLQQYLQVHGRLLDSIKATLEQRLADCFPDNPLDDSAACQEWLLPYFASLLDVELVSPDAEGQRKEIAHAIAWRKGKGTLRVVEAIVEAIGGREAEIQEGWRRVAITPRIGLPLTPNSASGVNLDVSADNRRVSAISIRHSGLSITTPDLRWHARAIETNADDPLARISTFNGVQAHWLHANPHAVPVFAGSYEDISKRTVDFRTPAPVSGHVHPGRLLIHLPPEQGFFTAQVKTVYWKNNDIENQSEAFQKLINIYSDENGVTVFRNRSMDSALFSPVRIQRVIELGKTPEQEGDPEVHGWRFEGLILDNTVIVHAGRLQLRQCAARKIVVHSIDISSPVLNASDCLFNSIEVARGMSRLEYCSVLQRTVSEAIRASDCIFMGKIQKDRPTEKPPSSGCMRYSRIHPKQAGGGAQLVRSSLSRETVNMFSTRFGEPTCGVLHPECSQTVRFGAEDGGEMGAFHQEKFCLRWQAVIDKLKDYMPLGIEPVLVPDGRLLCKPPKHDLSE